MVDKKIVNFVLGISFLILLVFLVGVVSAENCWLYTSSDSCSAVDDCNWKSDAWGGWCEELNCWSLWAQDDCQNTTLHEQIGKTCSWRAGGTFYNCEKVSCYSFSGTNQTACESNNLGLSCQWDNYCLNTGTNLDMQCWDYNNSENCNKVKGCSWGGCYEKGCWSYNDETNCTAGKDWQGRNCKWENNYCTENGCWKYGANISMNLSVRQAECNSATGVACQWNSNWKNCEEKGCWSFDFTNESFCVNNSLNLSCVYNGNYCDTEGCWNYNTQSNCQNQPQCTWRVQTSSGWCEETQCWSFDGNQTGCTESSLGCSYENGWCFKDFSGINCTSITTDRACMDTYYCWWESIDWNNASAGTCNEPNWAGGGGAMFNEWNPGCYIFDMNSTNCGKILGCYNSTEVTCVVNSTHDYADKISDSGLNCTMINDSSLCNSITMLSSCCSWESGECKQNKFSNTCWEQMEEPPVGAAFCEDYSAFTSQTLCEQIAGHPWYMPCKWNSSSERCGFNAVSVFGNETQSLSKIDNKKNCEIAGGKWIIENYCELNNGSYVSVPSGRCEYKFDEEDNCNKACFACENKNSAGVVVNSSADAKSACENSQLGFCEFTANSNAPNGFGYCDPKEQFQKGIAGKCGASDCGACTFMGVVSGTNGTKTPEQYCNDYKANCTWVPDSSSPTLGYCTNKGEKTCLTSCDRCYTQSDCQDKGRTAFVSQNGCKWQIDSSTSTESCVANTDGNVEICFDGIDNNDNGLVDCQDPSCYSDSFCGLVSGNCWDYSILGKDTCEADSNCEWVMDMFGSFCDFKGSQCWKYNGNQESCQGVISIVNENLNISAARIAGNAINESRNFTLRKLGVGWVVGSIVIVMNDTGININQNYSIDFENQVINFLNTAYLNTTNISDLVLVSYQYNSSHSGNCQWNNGGMGTVGWCEMDWSLGEVCMVLNNETECGSTPNCVWTNDTWCQGSGAETSWCESNGGWCDHESFKPKDCWLYSSNSTCNDNNCTWQRDEWNTNQCDMNMSINQECWSKSPFDCGLSDICYWESNTYMMGGGECRSAGQCWDLNDATSCGANDACIWNIYINSCESKCTNPNADNKNETSCLNIKIGDTPVCVWKDEPGYCMETSGCWNYNETSCGEQTICRWKEPGFCDPIGFSSGSVSSGGGGGGGGASECWRYDGNESACVNKTLIGMSCGWMSEMNPRCEINFGTNCWQYNEGNCTAGNGCWFNSGDGGSGWCMNLMDQCWSNSSYQAWNNSEWQGNCSANPLCTNQSWGCEPVCFSLSSDDCVNDTYSGKCKYMTGWCNSVGMNQMFTGMENGAPVMIGTDDCGEEGIQGSVDICGFGMKDMGDSYGFGTGVYNFENASVCNKEKIMPSMFTGQPMMPGQEKTGTGTDEVNLVVYLDTDGATTGGCSLLHNTSVGGYEFRLRYSAEWNNSLTESFNAYRCDSGSWKAVDIKLSAWRKKMCSETGGPMIAVKKDDLAKYPTLYDSTKDFRVYVATIDDEGNTSSPTDTAGPGWVTPGAVDFELSSLFSYGADSTKFSDILSKGFVSYGADCFTEAGCADYSCYGHQYCEDNGYGVHNTSFVDTTMPQVVGIKIEEYPDSALVMYDTNKLTTGQLQFYGTDSGCSVSNLNATINDTGLLKDSVKTSKLWHDGKIYNDGGEESLDYDLSNETTYYYKLKVCDSANKCAVSKCSSFKTSSVSKCSYCNFVTRIKAPTGWVVSYDLDTDGEYEHIQGQVCGANAGMKTNYTSGRKANIKMENEDGSVYFEFLNVTLTKTMLNDKVRTISTAGDLIADDEKAGMTSQTRDKIINNLHPEVCRVKVPEASDGSCGTLYHCDDSGNNCIDKTAAAGGEPIDADECLWNAPYCEFSTYKTADTPSSPPGASSPGGGSTGAVGGAASPNATEETPDELVGGELDDSEKPDETLTDTGDGKTRNLLWLWILIVLVISGVVGFIIYQKQKR